ncbi:MAG TPA: von Willebrand factor type A domain-containing protein, partial [Allosphingosinicella sp.]|nr:von Willebrand factor type A domain-containing protein [Allosphingosinicella sp.]
MSRLPHAIAIGLAVASLAACSKSGIDSVSPPDGASASAEPSPAEEALAEADIAADEMIVTGSRIANPNLSSASPMSVAGSSAARHAHGGHPPYFGRDRFTSVAQNGFKVAAEEPVSTFSIDVDTASYSFVRASLNRNVLPQQAAVRTEEMINYFPYDYAPPRNAAQPFSSNISVFPSPWSAGRKLVRIGIKGYSVQRATRPRANLVFLIDTSGSMNEPNKLPLVQQSLSMLLDQLSPNDSVAIVAYAGTAGTVLEPTPASQKARIRSAIDRLGAGGSTAGAEGIRQAYALAERNFDPKGVNRVILATDGDFNVGITDPDELKGFVERERGKGVFLSVLGFGMGNYNDALMQTLAQNGNGAAAYIDTVAEARKTLVEEATSTLFPIARDVKIQVEFNPATVAEYRL